MMLNASPYHIVYCGLIFIKHTRARVRDSQPQMSAGVVLHPVLLGLGCRYMPAAAWRGGAF